jgi:hypothetical protein
MLGRRHHLQLKIQCLRAGPERNLYRLRCRQFRRRSGYRVRTGRQAIENIPAVLVRRGRLRASIRRCQHHFRFRNNSPALIRNRSAQNRDLSKNRTSQNRQGKAQAGESKHEC